MGGPIQPAPTGRVRSATATRGLPAVVASATASTSGLSAIVANGRKLRRCVVVAALLALSLSACDVTSAPADTQSPAVEASSPTPAATALPSTALPSTATAPAIAAPSATAPFVAAGIPAGVAMPNAHSTPGDSFAGVTSAQVCTTGWASAHRHVTTAQYHEVYAAYGIRYPEPTGTYELDHLIPLEIGGDNANANLWPEPASPTPGFHQKDALENALHHLVCSGQLALGVAQHSVAVNWYAAYRKYVTG
jgi:hypothetical protein